MQQQRQQLEAQLYRLRPALKLDPVTNTQVAAALRAAAPQGLLIEFQKYRPYGSNAKGKAEWGPERYLALLLRPDGTIRSIPLGEAAPIEKLVAKALDLSERKLGDVDEPLQALSEKLLGPLRQELAGIQELFISPDAELNRLPFAALPMPGAPGVPAKLLSEALQLRLLTSGRDLVRLQQPGRSGGPALLVANPEFTPGAITPACDPKATPPLRQAGDLWSALPCTALEATQLMPLLQVPRPLTGRDATTANVLASRRPRILHIASHGFFWSEQEARDQARSCGADVSGAQRSAPSVQSSAGIVSTATGNTPIAPAAPTTSQTFAALQRSGIVLAGANQPCRSAEQDGYLTAAEVTGMDLEGTELTTLSACQTGLGDVRSGEGVYGLQRALAVAGSRSTLLSLWMVSDAATQEFMTEFYKRLRRGEGRAAALAATQAAFRNHSNKDYRHVYYWAAFQLSGDWRPVPGW